VFSKKSASSAPAAPASGVTDLESSISAQIDSYLSWAPQQTSAEEKSTAAAVQTVEKQRKGVSSAPTKSLAAPRSSPVAPTLGLPSATEAPAAAPKSPAKSPRSSMTEQFVSLFRRKPAAAAPVEDLAQPAARPQPVAPVVAQKSVAPAKSKDTLSSRRAPRDEAYQPVSSNYQPLNLPSQSMGDGDRFSSMSYSQLPLLSNLRSSSSSSYGTVPMSPSSSNYGAVPSNYGREYGALPSSGEYGSVPTSGYGAVPTSDYRSVPTSGYARQQQAQQQQSEYGSLPALQREPPATAAAEVLQDDLSVSEASDDEAESKAAERRRSIPLPPSVHETVSVSASSSPARRLAAGAAPEVFVTPALPADLTSTDAAGDSVAAARRRRAPAAREAASPARKPAPASAPVAGPAAPGRVGSAGRGGMGGGAAPPSRAMPQAPRSFVRAKSEKDMEQKKKKTKKKEAVAMDEDEDDDVLQLSEKEASPSFQEEEQEAASDLPELELATQQLQQASLTTTTSSLRSATGYYEVSYSDADLEPYKEADMRRRKHRRGDETSGDVDFSDLDEPRTTIAPLRPVDLRSSIDFGAIDTRRASHTGMSSPPTSPTLLSSSLASGGLGSSSYELPGKLASSDGYSEPAINDTLMSSAAYSEPTLGSSGVSGFREYGYEACASEIDEPVLHAGAKRARAASVSSVESTPSSPTQTASDMATDSGSDDRDWNSEFQTLWDETLAENSATSLEDIYLTRAKIGTLAREFTDSATRIAKILVSEVFLPASQKTVRPIDVGGVGGGLKYVHRNVFFKFVVDEFGLYGGNESAAKTAKHELRGLQLYMNLALERRVAPLMHFPLTAVIDWRGFRVLASAVLPISRDSLVYGSADAGVTVRTDPQVAAWMEDAARLLNLKPHAVITRDLQTVVTMAACADIEVHRARDARTYMLDTHRVMPPQLPDGRKGAFLYNLFRPTFVARHAVPLCSDGFSLFGRGDESSSKYLATHNRELREATESLLGAGIDAVASACAERWASPDVSVDHRLVLAMLHRFGVNVRHIGPLRAVLYARSCDHLADLCLREMLARTLKALVRRQWRQLRTHIGDRDYVGLVCASLELLFATDAASVAQTTAFWCSSVQGMKAELSVRFGARALTVRERHADFRLAQLCDGRVTVRLCELLGIELHAAARARLSEPGGACVLLQTDVRRIAPRTARLYLVAFHDAYRVWASEESRALTGAARLAHLDECIERWFEVLNCAPDDVRALSNLAMAYKLRALHNLEAMDALAARDAELARTATELAFAPVHWLHQDAVAQVDDADTRYNAGVALREHAQRVTGDRRSELLALAAEQFEAAVRARRDDQACLLALANTCVQQALRCRFNGESAMMREHLARTGQLLQQLSPTDEAARLANVLEQLRRSIGLQGEAMRAWWDEAREVLQQKPAPIGGRIYTLSTERAVVTRAGVVSHPMNTMYSMSDQSQMPSRRDDRNW
jgi:hypothetical protein